MSSQGAAGYAGDLSAEEAWSLLQREPTAQLIDVRTLAEWAYVGLPDLSSLGREAMRIQWQVFPTLAPNPNFAAEVSQALSGADRDAPVIFLCRSGVRSRAAAIAMTQAGYSRAYNLAGGFEGDLDSEGHRGSKNGWKVSGLPWRQT